MASDQRSCGNCGHDNRPQARFCEECGRPLAVACSSCGTELRAGARFCDSCGAPFAGARPPPKPPAAEPPRRDPRTYTPKHLTERILTSRNALEGERKQVTVLFADVTGSMELAEQVDAEEWHRLLDRFFEILTEGVHRFEGTINQYTGDGVMALFGAPLAHEDHAHRACYAALQLQTDLRRFAHELKRDRELTFATRIGLNSGEVVVGKIGDDLRMDYTAQGHVVGIAARLQALADPGKVYVSRHTADLVQGFFELESLGDFRIKGVSQPLAVFSLDGVGRMRTRLDVSRARGLSRFVGRQDEMAVLDAALTRAAGGQAQVVGVVADAGTGKSRICAELVERCRARGIAVREARGVAHGRLLPFLPLLELLRDVFSLEENDGAREARQKIAGTMVLLDPRFEEALPAVFEFLGVPDPERPAPVADPADRRRQLFAIIARLVRALGEREPSVLVLEDLHWFDDGTASFLESLVDAISGTKTLLLLNFRPEFRAPWIGKTTYQQLPLLPLGAAAIAELLDELLGRDASLAGLRELIRERTGGNPFYVEEAVLSLVEAGSLEGTRGAHRLVHPLTSLRVPPTVQALLAARIDRLPERERSVLQAAAVIGKQFPESILRRVAAIPDAELDEALRALRARDFLFEEALFPEIEYAFKHPLTQEVAYGTQLVERRKEAHAAVAALFEESEPSRLDEQAALIAHHWQAAGEPLRAARWHRRAAEWSENNAPSSAVAHWRAVRALGAEIEDPAESARLRIEASIGLVRAADYDLVEGAEMESAFEEGRRLAIETGDLDARVRVLLAYSAQVLNTGAFERSEQLLGEAGEAADASGDANLRFVVRGHCGYICVLRGEQRRALEHYEEAFALLGGRVPTDSFFLRRYYGASTNRAMILGESGRLQEAFGEIRQLLEKARDTHDLTYECIAQLCLSRLSLYRGEGREAVEHAEHAIESAERLDALGFRATSRLALASGYFIAGEDEQAIALFEDAAAIATAESVGPNMMLMLHARLAQALFRTGKRERALALATESAGAARSSKRLGAVEAFLAFARVLLASGSERFAEVEEALDAAMAVARQCSGRVYEPLIAEERARLAVQRGDNEVAARAFDEALGLFREIGATGHVRRLEDELAPSAASAGCRGSVR
jgi:class 3 adenylate cyclase/tetratricopeptide (TPR) repeat protein